MSCFVCFSPGKKIIVHKFSREMAFNKTATTKKKIWFLRRKKHTEQWQTWFALFFLSLSFFSTSFTTNDQFNEKKTLFLLLLLISSNHDHDKINQILFCNLIFRFHCQTNEIHAKKSNEYWSFRYVGDNWWIENVCICYCNCSMYSILPSEQIHFVDWQELMKNMFVHQMQGTNRPSA